jgi:hypothetical protein
VLCLTPESSDGVADSALAEDLPTDVDIVRVAAWSEQKCRRFGFGHADYRAWVPLFRAGTKLLKRTRYDVVFFSTTMFQTFLMGPIWKRRYGCKLVYDFQDPWHHVGPSPYTKTNVPGAWWKYRLSQWMAYFFEKHALKSADHVISVSAGYVRNLSTSHPHLTPRQFTVLPFGVATEDFDFVKRRGVEHGLFQPDKGVVRWVYAGRGGPDMVPTVTVLLQQLSALRLRAPEFAGRLRVYFVGTNYSPAHRTYKVVEPLAYRHGVQDLVEERPERLPYHRILSLYSECDAILLLGSSSGDYTASKFFNCVASKKPVLAFFHRNSLVTTLAMPFPNVSMVSFDPDPAGSDTANAIARGLEWLRNPVFDATKIDEELKAWSAEEMTRQQCAIFSVISEQ